MNYNLINKIAEEYGTPYQLYDEKIIREKGNFKKRDDFR